HEDGGDPVRRPCPFIGVVDAGERLERDAVIERIERGQRPVYCVGLVHGRNGGAVAAEVVPVAAHGERSSPDRTAEIKGENLRTLVAPELQGHEGEQHGFARARGADDKGMAYVTDMET